MSNSERGTIKTGEFHPKESGKILEETSKLTQEQWEWLKKRRINEKT